MSAVGKRRCLEDESSSSEGESENSEPTDDVDMEMVQVDFEAFSPTDRDIPGIMAFLKQIFVHTTINLCEVAKLIVRQAHQVGSVLKQGEIPGDSDEEDDEPIFGLISVINLTERKHEPCVQQLRAWLQESCKHAGNKVQQQLLEEIGEDDSQMLGLILCERMRNLPPKIVIPLYQSLKKEMDTTPRKFTFNHIIRVTKVYKQIQKTSNPDLHDVEEYANEEDRIFQQFSTLQFECKVEEETALCGKWEAKKVNDEYEQHCRVIVIPGDKLDIIIDKMVDQFSD